VLGKGGTRSGVPRGATARGATPVPSLHCCSDQGCRWWSSPTSPKTEDTQPLSTPPTTCWKLGVFHSQVWLVGPLQPNDSPFLLPLSRAPWAENEGTGRGERGFQQSRRESNGRQRCNAALLPPIACSTLHCVTPCLARTRTLQLTMVAGMTSLGQPLPLRHHPDGCDVDCLAKGRQFIILNLIRWNIDARSAPCSPLGTIRPQTWGQCPNVPQVSPDSQRSNQASDRQPHYPQRIAIMHQTKPFLGTSAGPRATPPCSWPVGLVNRRAIQGHGAR